MRRKQTIFGRLRQILLICGLACLYSAHALEIRPGHAAGASHVNGFSASNYTEANDCVKSNGAENPSKQGKAGVKCCLHCANANGSEYDSTVQPKTAAVIETLMPKSDYVLGWVKDSNSPLLPNELLTALLATRGPPLFS